MINALIVDNETSSSDSIENLINRYLKKKIHVLEKLNNVNLAIDVINKNDPDLLFLDVALKDRSGLELLHHFSGSRKFEVIFVSENQTYAMDAVKNSAIDYLLKPVNMVDLVTALKRFEHKRSILNSSLKDYQLNESKENQTFKKRETIAFPLKSGFRVEHISSILYCEANGNITNINLYNKSFIKISKTLKRVEEMIDHPDFFRIHKSYFINMNHITSYNRAENLVELSDGTYLPVSVRKTEPFKKKLVNRY